jgi:hypothetical protein
VSPAPVSCSALATRYFTYQIVGALAGAALLFIGVRISAGTFPEAPAPAGSAEVHVGRCDRPAVAAVDELAANGIDVRSDEWRRERDSAREACMNDFAKFNGLKNNM